MGNRNIEHDLFGRPAKKGINSKQKGNSNERVAAKWLERWVGVPFTRVPMSGGLRWKDSPNVCGDVVCEVSSFYMPMSVETKHLKALNCIGKLRANSKIYEIWEQATVDAVRGNKLPMAVLRENGMAKDTFVIYFDNDFTGLLESRAVKKISWSETLTGFDSEDLLAKVTFAEFTTHLKEVLSLL